MRLTKRERAQVVELLKCGADVGSLGMASFVMGGDNNIWAYAVDAQTEVFRERGWRLNYETACLEAAARVEAGQWP
jgi:hypothetical protein